MTPIVTWANEQVTIDFHPDIYDQVLTHYEDFNLFLEKLKSLNAELARNRDLFNINAYPEPINKGIYILGKDASDFGIFPHCNLALKCSVGNPWAENLRKQFYRSIQFAQDFETRLNSSEKKLLQLCPVYLHVQSRDSDDFFKQILFMQKIESGITLGHTETGFSQEFRQVFNIPSLEEISRNSRFILHLHLDKNKHRQLLKIQTVYLFHRLVSKGIKIWSLNQKNVLLDSVVETGQTKYIIIDPTEDFFPPLSPLYNALTHQLCT